LEAAWGGGELRRLALRVAGEAAGMLRDRMCMEENARILRGDTAAIDLESERYIVEALRGEGFRGAIVGEETGLTPGEPGPVALVDPLDGSKNYLSCMPWASVSIAFLDPQGSPIAGAVAPVFNWPPLSFGPDGCYEGGERLSPGEPRYRIIYTYVEKPDAAAKVVRIVERLQPVKVRSMGSAALELAWVAAGRALAFADLRGQLRNIDVAAAAGLIQRCGGHIVDGSGNPIKLPVDRVARIGSVVAARNRETLNTIIEAAGGTG